MATTAESATGAEAAAALGPEPASEWLGGTGEAPSEDFEPFYDHEPIEQPQAQMAVAAAARAAGRGRWRPPSGSWRPADFAPALGLAGPSGIAAGRDGHHQRPPAAGERQRIVHGQRAGRSTRPTAPAGAAAPRRIARRQQQAGDLQLDDLAAGDERSSPTPAPASTAPRSMSPRAATHLRVTLGGPRLSLTLFEFDE